MLINVALGWVYGRITTRKKDDESVNVSATMHIFKRK
jgi:hypothetical protein